MLLNTLFTKIRIYPWALFCVPHLLYQRKSYLALCCELQKCGKATFQEKPCSKPFICKGSGQNSYTRKGPTKPQNRWWSLPAPPFPPSPSSTSKDGVFIAQPPLYSAVKMTVRFKPHFSYLSSNADSCYLNISESANKILSVMSMR